MEKRARFDGSTLAALRLTGEIAGAERLRQALLMRSDIAGLRQQLLVPLAELAGLPRCRGRTVCSCLDVGEDEICGAISAGQTLAGLQATLQCGTQCGSCEPELRRLVLEYARPCGHDAHSAARTLAMDQGPPRAADTAGAAASAKLLE